MHPGSRFRVLKGGGNGCEGMRDERASLLKSIRGEWAGWGCTYGEGMAFGIRRWNTGNRRGCLPSALAVSAWLELSDVYNAACSTLALEKLGRMAESLHAALGYASKMGDSDRKSAILLYNAYAAQFRGLFKDAGLEPPRQLRGEADLNGMLERYWTHVRIQAILPIEEGMLARGEKPALPTLTEWHREERRRAWKKED